MGEVEGSADLAVTGTFEVMAAWDRMEGCLVKHLDHGDEDSIGVVLADLDKQPCGPWAGGQVVLALAFHQAARTWLGSLTGRTDIKTCINQIIKGKQSQFCQRLLYKRVDCPGQMDWFDLVLLGPVVTLWCRWQVVQQCFAELRRHTNISYMQTKG